ncbi:hypothetical protein UFOVP1288_35 [uncultured Caudovirales phage]|uniref:Uncharacterized protein n=1 Tax=uncultured Caudovirales phage TaxID=2100421 RepID=A0A6J5S841_9CAUD|nr:hypothetical protein UFOVP1195_35 [uncultured Caudovirales phage]CAB4195727.1 hypothetical protein UFOVP1288_35 [uncultured Caudovirales phage]CAB4204978.1 hypothetical protein UFOVP1409_35 [uncultured Caudovirales phage]
MEAKPFHLQSPEGIAKEYAGNKQRIAQAMQSGLLDPTSALMAGMFIDRMRSAQFQEQGAPQTVAQQVFSPAQSAPQPGLGSLGAPQATPQMAPQQAPQQAPPPQMGMAEGGLADLPVPDSMYDEPSTDAQQYGGGGVVAFADKGLATDTKSVAATDKVKIDNLNTLIRNSRGAERDSLVAARDALLQQAWNARNGAPGWTPEEPVAPSEADLSATHGRGVALRKQLTDQGNWEVARTQVGPGIIKGLNSFLSPPSAAAEEGARFHPNYPVGTPLSVVAQQPGGGALPAPWGTGAPVSLPTPAAGPAGASTNRAGLVAPSVNPSAPRARGPGGPGGGGRAPAVSAAPAAPVVPTMQDLVGTATGAGAPGAVDTSGFLDAYKNSVGTPPTANTKRQDALDAYYEKQMSPEAMAKQKKEDMWTALAQMGLGMMSTKSPNFLQSVGEAGAAALPGLREAVKDRKAREAAGLQALAQSETSRSAAELQRWGLSADRADKLATFMQTERGQQMDADLKRQGYEIQARIAKLNAEMDKYRTDTQLMSARESNATSVKVEGMRARGNGSEKAIEVEYRLNQLDPVGMQTVYRNQGLRNAGFDPRNPDDPRYQSNPGTPAEQLAKARRLTTVLTPPGR